MILTKVESITDQLIKDHFPKLRGVKILFEQERKVDYFGATLRVGVQTFKLYYHRKLLKADEDAIRGCMAHELCHVEKDITKNLFCYILEAIALKLSAERETKSERAIDRMVLEKGLGKELLAFQKFHDKYYEPYDQTDGLTKKEIKAYLKDNKI